MSYGSEVVVRPIQSSDLPRVASIFRTAFNEMYRRRGFGPVVADQAVGAVIAETYRALDPEHCLVVAVGDRVVGSGFLHVRGGTAGTGPITIDPAYQGSGCGRALMAEICRRADEAGVRSLRLIQDAFNEASFCLYGRVGFVARETLVRGSFASRPDVGSQGPTRRATNADIPLITALEREIVGIDRGKDHELFLRMGDTLLAGAGEITGCLSRLVRGGVAVLGPGVSRDLDTMLDLIQGATRDLPLRTDTRLLVPASRSDLLAAMYEAGFEVHSLCTYMVRGEFHPFDGYYVPTLFPESG